MRYLLVFLLLGCGRMQRLEDRFDELEEASVRNQTVQTETVQSLVDNVLTASKLLQELVNRVLDLEADSLISHKK